MVDEEGAYRQELDEVVLGLRECTGFDELMTTLGEPHPPAVLESVARLLKADLLDEDTAERLCRLGSPSEARVEAGLPVPHFQDGDWRFTLDTSDALARLVTEGNAEDILLIGAPSVWSAALRSKPAYNVVALDACARTVNSLNDLAHAAPAPERFNALHVDVARSAPLSIRADSVFMDPPWYQYYVDHFLWFASMHCKPQGRVFCVFPGRLTRPGIDRQRQEQLFLAQTFGLEVIQTYPKMIRYESPPFEIAALAAHNLTLTAQWRSADLIVFRRTVQICAPRPSALPPEVWEEFTYRDVRFRTFPSAFASAFDPMPLPLKGVPFDEGRQSIAGFPNVYPSTSRRTPAFSLIRVMTSGQQAFACENTALFLRIGQALESQQEPSVVITEYLGRRLSEEEVTLIQRTTREIERIAQREKQTGRNDAR